MSRTNIIFLSVLICGVLNFSPARAATPEESFKYAKYYDSIVVNADGTQDEKVTVSLTILRADALEGLKQFTIPYSTSAETVDVLEAYTQKPDGHKINADKNNFQLDVNGGRKGAAPAFSDQSSLTVVFPEVSVGDTVTVVYDKKVIKPLFPKMFSSLWTFSRSGIYDDARIHYSIPVSLHAKYESFGLQETENKKENGRQILAWTFKNLTVKKKKFVAEPVEEIGDDPSLAVSSFPSYEAMAKAYGEKANPKAKITKQIQVLADKITKGMATPRDKAKALYDWEIENITYAGNCIGIGAVVPRDLDFVLQNKMGDCKDHATLLQALLKAGGIESTQALIGYNDIYTLPKVPLMSVINHVINYIPGMKMYLDATSGMPFGYLPMSLSGKPVLLVDGYRKGATTPKYPINLVRLKIDAKVTLTKNGAADGVTTVAESGPLEASQPYEQGRKNLTAETLKEDGEHALEESGYQGSVTYEPVIWDEKTMTYTFSIRYHLDDYVHPGTPGAFDPEPPFSPEYIAASISPVMEGLTKKDNDQLKHGYVCHGGFVGENYQYILPKKMNVLAVPEDVTASSTSQTYSSHYALSGRILTVSRELKDAVAGPTCASEMHDSLIPMAKKAWTDLKAQIVYK